MHGWLGLPLRRVFTDFAVALLLGVGALSLSAGLTALLYSLIMVAAVIQHQLVTPLGYAEQ